MVERPSRRNNGGESRRDRVRRKIEIGAILRRPRERSGNASSLADDSCRLSEIKGC